MVSTLNSAIAFEMVWRRVSYAYIGILGGIGVGFSAQYGWQAVFNTFGL